MSNDSISKAIAEIGNSIAEKSARGWPWGTYGDTLELLKAIEDRLSTRKRIPLKRFVIVPVYLWLRGLQQIAINYGRVYVVAFTLGLLGLFFSKYLPADIRPQATQLTLLFNLFAAFTLVFAAPSTYCSAGTNEKHVATVMEKLGEWQIETTSRVDLILKNIKVFEERVKYRLQIFRWLLGVGWTIYFSPALTDAGKTWATSGGSLTQFATLFPPFAYLVALFVMVESYARGVDIMFRCLELGCNEKLAQLDKKKSEEPKKGPFDGIQIR